ncbi:MAG: hypothetical protein ACFFDN_44370, partial [Candidatus Hodarchaeota archaeon]
MDTGTDFIQSEFLNLLFFQQKNLVIFPYVDLKHLHTLEIFAVGHNIVDLESTALHNLKEILEFESNNTYSQNPTLYFIYNVDRKKLRELMDLKGIRCVINSNENVGNLADGSKFIFYNKKNNQFVNYNIDESELEFETYLITSSQDEEILQEKIQKIKMLAKRIFKELNHKGNLEILPEILVDYEEKYWNSILTFTANYYDIKIPDICDIQFKPLKKLKDYSKEYEILISTNKNAGKEFIQLLHDYRCKKVNSAHLELEELYNPQKLYNYLRNHHWKDGVPEDFIIEWIQMNISQYQLTREDMNDFETIFKKLNISNAFLITDNEVESSEKIESKLIDHHSQIPPITKYHEFKSWLLSIIKHVENRLNITDSKGLSIDTPSIRDFTIYKTWFLNKLDMIEGLLDSQRKNMSNTLAKNFNDAIFVIDGANIALDQKDSNGKGLISGLYTLETALQNFGVSNYIIISDKSLRYNINDREGYSELL